MKECSDYCEYFLGLRRPVVLDWSFLPTVTNTLKQLFGIADNIKYPLVILPYKEKDGKQTKEYLQESREFIRSHYGGYGSPGYFMQPRYIAVVQGKDWEDFWMCYQAAVTCGAIMVGIPDNIEFFPPEREEMIVDGALSYRYSSRRSLLVHYLHKVINTGLLRTRPNLKHCLIGLPHPLELQQYKDLGLFVHSVLTRLPFVSAVHRTVFYGGYAKTDETPALTEELREQYMTEVWDDEVIRLFKTNIKASIDFMGFKKKESPDGP
jgi:hypothetical protein